MATKAVEKKFDPKSAGFLHALITFILTVFATAGVAIQGTPENLSNTIVTSFQGGGIYAIIGVLVTSVAFPIYNFIKGGGKFSISAIFSRVSTWVALGTAALAAIALTGFILPDGTLDQVISAVQAKDWMSLVSILALTVGNTLIRYLKDKSGSPAG